MRRRDLLAGSLACVAAPARWPLSRRQTVIAAMIVVGAGLWFNWGWVAAIGAAPLILSLAPCAVMCATGYCVMCKSKGCDAGKTPNTATGGRGQ